MDYCSSALTEETNGLSVSQARTVSFVTGMERSPDGSELVVTYGVGDDAANLLRLSVAEVSQTLQPEGSQEIADRVATLAREHTADMAPLNDYGVNNTFKKWFDEHQLFHVHA